MTRDWFEMSIERVSSISTRITIGIIGPGERPPEISSDRVRSWMYTTT